MANLTVLTHDEILEILTKYDLGDLITAKPLEGGQANSSYKITTTTGIYTLSVCDEKTTNELKSLIRILDYLCDQNFATTKPMHTKLGKPFVFVNDKPSYIKEYVAGETIKTLTPNMLEQIGETLARLHSLSVPKDIPTGFAIELAEFDSFLELDLKHEFVDWLALKSIWIKEHIDPNSLRGIIHGDIFWDNLLFEGDKLAAVLDFEEASEFYLLFDLATTLIGCCSLDGKFNQDQIMSLLKGYQKARLLSDSDKSQLTPFIVYAASVASFWRFRQYNIRNPNQALKDSYQELAALADKPPSLF